MLMNKETDIRETILEELQEIIRKRAFNLMFTGGMMCSEAVLSVLNQGLGGGLSPDLAMKVAAGFAEGIGGSGCTCGALTGGGDLLGSFSFPKQFKLRRPQQSHGCLSPPASWIQALFWFNLLPDTAEKWFTRFRTAF